ncbi:hypothetical protein QM012_005511 [Aureobasidium pullulans]|uniref:Chromo domain-containing protein n=1 Tax=Aureobasidium pullulans TaxID=5580 RepID=A0ABR0T4M4_AURPU
MPEVLLQLERKIASHANTSTTSWPVPKDMVFVDSDRQSALRQEASQLESLVTQNRSQSHDSLDADRAEHELNSGPNMLNDDSLKENLEDVVGSPQTWDSCLLMTDDVDMDDNVSQDESGWVASDFGLDLRDLDPAILTAKQCAEKEILLKRDAEVAAQPCQSNLEGDLDPKLEGSHEQSIQQFDITKLSRPQQHELMAGRELSCDTSQIGSSPWPSSQLNLQADRPDPIADLSQISDVFSDLPDFDELMENVQDENSRQQVKSASVSDTRFVSDEELPPDSNPWLAAVRAGTNVTASGSNTPTSSAATNPPAPRRTRPRKSEPIVLIDTPARSKQRPRVSDSMFVSDDETDQIPPSSNPHLAAAIRRMAGRETASNTPKSSASTTRTSTPKLPPHLAPVRRAAHRRSLDPSSQLPTAEEKEILDQTEYPVVDIINVKIVNGERKYLIKWEPIHGRMFMDTWEPAENANAMAVRDWELIKKNRESGRRKQSKGSYKDVARMSTRLVEQPTRAQQPHEPSPELGEEDTSMFFVDSSGDKALGARLVPTPRARSSSPASLSDQVSFHTRSSMNTRDDQLMPKADSTAERFSRPTARYAAQRIGVHAVPPKRVAKSALKPAADSSTIAPIQPMQSMAFAAETTEKEAKKALRRIKLAKNEAKRKRKREEMLAQMSQAEREACEHTKALGEQNRKGRNRTRAHNKLQKEKSQQIRAEKAEKERRWQVELKQMRETHAGPSNASSS